MLKPFALPLLLLLLLLVGRGSALPTLSPLLPLLLLLCTAEPALYMLLLLLLRGLDRPLTALLQSSSAPKLSHSLRLLLAL
jgi:hypothetical protein